MNISEITGIIKDSFEDWYNRTYSEESPVSVAINCSDMQFLAIKAIHTVKVEVSIIKVKDGSTCSVPLVTLQENYNHGETSEDDAMREVLRKTLVKLYGFRR